MWTVPAQIFCAPTRAKLIAAARFIPGVCGVLVSSWSPGITLTPCSFQSISPGSWWSLIECLWVTGQFQQRERGGKYPENQPDQLDHVGDLRQPALHFGYVQLYSDDVPLQIGHIREKPLQVGLDLAHVVFERRDARFHGFRMGFASAAVNGWGLIVHVLPSGDRDAAVDRQHLPGHQARFVA